MSKIIGIDPGVDGGMALITKEGGLIDVCSNTGKSMDEIAAVFMAWMRLKGGIAACYIEKVGVRTGEGVQGAFTFGKTYGFVQGLSRGNNLETYQVYPAVWQMKFNCMTRGGKNVSKNKAIEMFNQWHKYRKITHATADAILIAEYGRLMEALRDKSI